MEHNSVINTAGNLNDDLVFLHEFKFDNNNSDITPSLSEYELQKIKEDLGMLDSGGEFDNSNLELPSIYVDGNTPTPFDPADGRRARSAGAVHDRVSSALFRLAQRVLDIPGATSGQLD